MKRTKHDAEWSLLIRKRANHTCQRCGRRHDPKSLGLHAAHIFTRSIKRTRHDPDNGVALCYGCHSWGHRNPLEFHKWVRAKIGPDVYDALAIRARRLK